ncbi:YbdD/YjiX family protein [Crenobacter sp. SG2303]|uniref:YbdD/YjiX family protein n=1 Tax=Crenobacter oryzisoli TaxID=3056844 RepID=A0ABT7XLU5_9NEIS|nr:MULTISPECIES: YbdD/YjiX family protein [unclassified Crenobacter]MDN0074763.1 YbdD/YjiX family protein [Crenobacter sp. SG2303]MDN0084153.1 YbdD/YjiX family protein [Crenobacter sp. SG2305]
MLKLMRQAVATARLMVGVKDYDAYVARRRRFNPDAPVMTRDEFFRACQEARFGKGNGRCPC